MTFAKYLISPIMAVVMTGMGSVTNFSKMTITIASEDKQPILSESVEPPSTIPDVIATVTRPEEPTQPKSQREANRDIVRVFTIKYFGEDQIDAMNRLIMKESGFNNEAKNPRSTAFGMFQFLNSTWQGTGIKKTSDPIQQTEAGCIYIKNRYGTPTKALSWHLSHNWY